MDWCLHTISCCQLKLQSNLTINVRKKILNLYGLCTGSITGSVYI